MKHVVVLAVVSCVMLAGAATRAEGGVASEAAEQAGRQFTKALGKEAAEFGGERATRELAERLIREGGEQSAARLGRIARAAEPSTIRALKGVPGQSLKHLDDVPEAELARAVGTLARPGVAQGLTSLGSDAVASAALRAEMRLPGAGATLVREFGDDGFRAAGQLGDTQANQLLKPDRVEVVRRLTAENKRALLDKLVAHPDAQVQVIRTAGKVAGVGVAVVAGGTVLWHGTDVALAPTERIVTHPDGTVERTTTSVGAQAAAVMPQVVEKAVPAMTAVGYAAVAALAIVGCAALLLRHRRLAAARRV
jgi:hypothetical protein